ncbi:MAG: hypothetical protein ABWX82_07800 [Leifsonia sp.]
MTPRKLPPPLTRGAFRTAAVDGSGTGRGRLRGHDVIHPFHGVNSVGIDVSTITGLCDAYAVRMLPGQYFSHVTAALLFGVPLPPGCQSAPVHVSVFAPRTPPRARGVVGHKVAIDGVLVGHRMNRPLVSPADAWCQLAELISREDLVAAGDYLISGRLTDEGREPPLATLDELAAAAERHRGKRGSAAIAWALERTRPGVDSRPESLLRLLLVAVGLPEPLIGDPTLVDDGRLTLHPDLKYPQWRIVLEYEGDGHRTVKSRWRGDISRRELFETAEWRVVRVTADDVFVDPANFVRRLRRIIHERESAGFLGCAP